MQSHFSAGTHGKVENGVPLLLVLRFSEDPRIAPQIKFPGGCQEGPETPAETLIWEFFEEVGGESFSLGDLREFHKQGDPQGHMQHFFLVSCYGDLRKVGITEEDGTYLYAPFYEDVRKLYYDDSFLRSHREALRKAILLLAEERSEFAYAADELGIAKGVGESISDKERSVAAP